MINLSKLRNFDKALDYHLKYFETENLETLIGIIGRYVGTKKGEFFRCLLLNYKKIIVGKPKELEEIVSMLKRHFPHYYSGLMENSKNRSSEIKLLAEELESVFNYKHFSEYRKVKWNAYQYINLLKIESCPYCDRNYITVHVGYYESEDENKVFEPKTRPHLDHFLDKSKHPYLAISLYNLIPCCYVCNSSFKGSKLFTTQTHLHPFVEGFDNYVKFSIDFKGSASHDFDYDIKDLFRSKYTIKLINKEHDDPGFFDRVERNKRVFQLENIYNYHKSISDELINQNLVYTPDRISEIYKSIPGLFTSEEDVKLTLLGLKGINLIERDKRTFSKYIKDISEELGLLRK